MKKYLLIAVCLGLVFGGLPFSADAMHHGKKGKRGGKQPNIIFVLTDDQRYDELGVLNRVLDTPNMDLMAKKGVHFRNAFVTTALCSPSRASIMSGQYMHNHGVVDNNAGFQGDVVFFPELLQKAGYKTAFVGKWHMGGHHDDPQKGFDHWVSFAGQGHYYPVKRGRSFNKLNVNGKKVVQKGYITDELTDYAVSWLKERKRSSMDKPFFLYLSHKAVHSNFMPAKRHEEQYARKRIPVPKSQADTPKNYKGKPRWVRDQRNSWHGVDFPYHSALNVQEYKRQYHRALSAVDDSLGVLFDWLRENGEADNTIVILMGDNGFLFGEHGLIDKRNAYEESMRVPMLFYSPGRNNRFSLQRGEEVEEMVANIDIAPTILEMAGVQPIDQFDGESFFALAKGEKIADWRSSILYEYYWEFNYPHTPTTFALRTDDYKLIQYHGVWDSDELYHIKKDPKESKNLIDEPRLLKLKVEMRNKLYALLSNRKGQHVVPYTKKFNQGAVYRERSRSRVTPFPAHWLKREKEKGLYDHHTPDSTRIKKR
ncbi:MAG: sulfatase family protein [Parvibaculales bacterium]